MCISVHLQRPWRIIPEEEHFYFCLISSLHKWDALPAVTVYQRNTTFLSFLRCKLADLHRTALLFFLSFVWMLHMTFQLNFSLATMWSMRIVKIICNHYMRCKRRLLTIYYRHMLIHPYWLRSKMEDIFDFTYGFKHSELSLGCWGLRISNSACFICYVTICHLLFCLYKLVPSAEVLLFP